MEDIFAKALGFSGNDDTEAINAFKDIVQLIEETYKIKCPKKDSIGNSDKLFASMWNEEIVDDDTKIYILLSVTSGKQFRLQVMKGKDAIVKKEVTLKEAILDVMKKTIMPKYEELVNTKKCKFAKNTILYGPPGTGKTYSTVTYAMSIINGVEVKEKYNDEEYQDLKKAFDDLLIKDDKEGQIQFVTFHQSYGYEDFIIGIKPEPKGDGVIYNVEPGVFVEFCERARGKGEPYVFIIDEINRGNISKIFGELITLIEEDRREGGKNPLSVDLPYEYEYKENGETKKEKGRSFSVPENVYILGTMNTADRSIALLDTALRRRFNFVEMMPKPELLPKISINGTEIDVNTMLDTINKRITILLDREHQIGHSYFMDLNENSKIDDLADVFENRIIPLLQEYFYDDYEKIQIVLGDNSKFFETKEDPKNKYQFIKYKTIKKNGNNYNLGEKLLFRSALPESIDDLFSEQNVKIYEINKDAFKEPNAYKGIYESIKENKDEKTDSQRE